MLSSESWKNSNAFKEIQKTETQKTYYKRMNADADVMALVELDSKPFGSKCEKILCEIFQLDKRTSTQNDGCRLKKKLEIKTARYWAGADDCKWQHLEKDHDFEIALLAVLDFHGFKVWAVTKTQLFGELFDKKIVTRQGEEGHWTTKSAILPYLTPITSITDLDAFIAKL